MAVERKMSDYWERFMRIRHSRRTWLCGAGSGAMTVLLAACATSRGQSSRSSSAPSAAGQTQPKSGGALNSFTLTNVGDLDVSKTGGQGSQVVADHAMSRVVRFKVSADPAETFSSDPVGDVAVSWESPDAVTWTFKIRPAMKFHNISPVNGHAVEAEDVRQSLMRELAINSPAAVTLTMLDANQIEAPSSDTLTVKLKTATGSLPKALGAYANAIFPREAATGAYDPSKVVIGSGPFLLDSYTPDVAVVFKKNSDWYESGHPYVDVSRAAIIPDESQQLAQFSAGNLDIVTVSNTNLDTAQRSNPKAKVLTYLKRDGEVLVGHMNLPGPYQDVRVRRALSLAIDRDALGKAALGGKYTIGHLTQPAFGKWSIPMDQLGDAGKWFKYDPTSAKQLLEAAGATDTFHTIYYPFNGYGSQFNTVVETVGSMLQAVGLKVRLVQLDYQKDFLNSGKGVSYGNYPADALVVPNVGAYTNAEDWLLSNFTPGSVRNKSQVTDQTLISMIRKMSAIVNDEERLKAAADIERYLAGQLYYIPTVYPYQSTLVQPRVQNFQYSVNVPETETYAELWLQA